MSRKDIIKALKDRGFTGTFELFYWNNDGWYCNCDQMLHNWLGFNAKDAVEQIKSGRYDDFIGNRTEGICDNCGSEEIFADGVCEVCFSNEFFEKMGA